MRINPDTMTRVWRGIFAVGVLGAACSGPDRPATGSADTTKSRDSLFDVAALEKAFADEASLHKSVRLAGLRVPGLYGGVLSTGAVKITLVSADSTVIGYYLSLESEGLNETVSEYELGNLLAGIDSIVSGLARPAYQGSLRNFTYKTSQGVNVGHLAGTALGAVVYVGGSGRTAFMKSDALPSIRAAVVAARDSIAVLKRLPTP